jgi:hypothetical protein
MAEEEIVLAAQAVVYRAGGTQGGVTQSRRCDQIEIFPRLNRKRQSKPSVLGTNLMMK